MTFSDAKYRFSLHVAYSVLDASFRESNIDCCFFPTEPFIGPPWHLHNRSTALSLQQVIIGRMVSGLGGAGLTAMVSIIITGMAALLHY